VGLLTDRTDAAPVAGPAVTERIRAELPRLPPAERRVARVVLVGPVEAGSPFTALTPGMAVVETLVAWLVDRLGGSTVQRMGRDDRLSADVLSTVGSRPAGRPGAPDPSAG
jgi:hypothetical protein